MTFNGIIMTGMLKVVCFVYSGKKNHLVRTILVFYFTVMTFPFCSNEQQTCFQSPLFLPKQNEKYFLQIIRGRLVKVTFNFIESVYILGHMGKCPLFSGLMASLETRQILTYMPN